MEGNSQSINAPDDVELCESVPTTAMQISEGTTATNSIAASRRRIMGFIQAFVNRPMVSCIKTMIKCMRGNASRPILTGQDTIHMPSLSIIEVGLATTSSCEPASPSNDVSVRVERLMQVRGEYASNVEFEIEASKDHWSELHPTRKLTVETSDEEEWNHETDVEVFENLQKQWDEFFHDSDQWVVGEEIAEGGQVEIFNAKWGGNLDCVLKVFKEGYKLRDLQKLWPLGMLQNQDAYGYTTANSCQIYGATLLKNGRIAFQMKKNWRKRIDFRMQLNQNEGSPFTESEVIDILAQFVDGMQELHKQNIVHRILKASNVLINGKVFMYDFEFDHFHGFDPIQGNFRCNVADFECSIGVVGTGYWRAPEILQAVQDHDIKPELFTKEADVYSFAMTCYEVLTGCIPFEDLGGNSYNVVE